jgi:hypothetical protein
LQHFLVLNSLLSHQAQAFHRFGKSWSQRDHLSGVRLLLVAADAREDYIRKQTAVLGIVKVTTCSFGAEYFGLHLLAVGIKAVETFFFVHRTTGMQSPHGSMEEGSAKNPLSIGAGGERNERRGPPGPPPRPGNAPHGGSATPSNPVQAAGQDIAVSSVEPLATAQVDGKPIPKTAFADKDAKETAGKPLSSARSFMLKKDTAGKDKAKEAEAALAQDEGHDSDNESENGEAKRNPCARFIYTIATNQVFSGFMMLVTLFALFGDGECVCALLSMHMWALQHAASSKVVHKPQPAQIFVWLHLKKMLT